MVTNRTILQPSDIAPLDVPPTQQLKPHQLILMKTTRPAAKIIGTMAEAEVGTEDAAEKQMADERKHLHPPNKKKYEEELELLVTTISSKEAELKMVNTSAEETCQTELRNTRAEKNLTVEKRKKIDADLRCHNQEISKQMARLTKLQSNLQYKNEERISEAMRRLNYQLTSHNFTLSEEKKIVAEIDSLKRSKKVLEQYLSLKKEIDGMRDQQKKLREERDRLHKTVTQLKTKEDKLKKQKTKSEFLRKEIDELYEQKRARMAQFKVQEREYQLLRAEARKKFHAELMRKKSLEKQAQQAALRRERDEYKVAEEPFKDELQLCTTLTVYLQRFLNNGDTNTTTNTSDTSSAHSGSSAEGNSGQAKDLQAAGLYLLKKKDEDLFTGVTRSKNNKRSKRDKRKQNANKLIVHSPEIFAQFSSLGMKAPSTLTEVASIVDMLEAKMEYYSNRRLVVGGSAIPGDVASNSDHDGSAESAICESIPSTPDVQLDSAPPTFSPDGSGVVDEAEVRRLSHDSGTCEFNDGTGCCTDSQSVLHDGMMLNRSLPVRDSGDATRASCLQNMELDESYMTMSPTTDTKYNGDDEIIIRNKLQNQNDLQPVPLIDKTAPSCCTQNESH
ncbi:hypothetical protein LSAT2_032243 [Lamellibrachia satsuma]|nr:hypothetical protein LSAT2_032243 [Lamellibrachia satsuma]